MQLIALFVKDDENLVCFFLFEDENKSCFTWCYPPSFAKNLTLQWYDHMSEWRELWLNRRATSGSTGPTGAKDRVRHRDSKSDGL